MSKELLKLTEAHTAGKDENHVRCLKLCEGHPVAAEDVDKMVKAGMTADAVEVGMQKGIGILDLFGLWQKYGPTFIAFFNDLMAVLKPKAG